MVSSKRRPATVTNAIVAIGLILAVVPAFADDVCDPRATLAATLAGKGEFRSASMLYRSVLDESEEPGRCRILAYSRMVHACMMIENDDMFGVCANELLESAKRANVLDGQASTLMSRFADLLSDQGQTTKAEEIWLQLLSFGESTSEHLPGHRLVRATIYEKLGNAALGGGKPQEAEAYFHNALELVTEPLHPDTYLTIAPSLGLGRAQMAARDFASAAESFDRAVQQSIASFGHDSRATLTALTEYRSALLELDRKEDADRVLEHIESIRSRLMAQD